MYNQLISTFEKLSSSLSTSIESLEKQAELQSDYRLKASILTSAIAIATMRNCVNDVIVDLTKQSQLTPN